LLGCYRRPCQYSSSLSGRLAHRYPEPFGRHNGHFNFVSALKNSDRSSTGSRVSYLLAFIWDGQALKGVAIPPGTMGPCIIVNRPCKVLHPQCPIHAKSCNPLCPIRTCNLASDICVKDGRRIFADDGRSEVDESFSSSNQEHTREGEQQPIPTATLIDCWRIDC